MSGSFDELKREIERYERLGDATSFLLVCEVGGQTRFISKGSNGQLCFLAKTVDAYLIRSIEGSGHSPAFNHVDWGKVPTS